MPGMAMDPNMMSQMYGGFGGQGMGVNGMNVGMGFNAGQGAFGGYPGQPGAWNSGQEQFNQSSFGLNAHGMGSNFGSNASYGGYNMPPQQGNFNQMNHQQFPHTDFQPGYHGQGFPNRGRGRGGRYPYGGRGRGGHYPMPQVNHANNEAFHHQLPPQLQQTNPYNVEGRQPITPNGANAQQPQEAGRAGTANAISDEAAQAQMNKELAPGDANDDVDTAPQAPSKEEEVKAPDNVQSTVPETNGEPAVPESQPVEDAKPTSEPALPESTKPEESESDTTEKPRPIETFISDPSPPAAPRLDTAPFYKPTELPSTTPITPLAPAAAYTGDSSHDLSPRGRGSSRGIPRGVPFERGALRGGRGTGYLPNGAPSHVPSNPPAPSHTQPQINHVPELKGVGVIGAPTGPKAMREPPAAPKSTSAVRGGRGFSIVGRASAAAHSQTNGHAASRRYSILLPISSHLTGTFSSC